MNSTDALLLHGVVAVCPDCGDERIMVEAAPFELCCTTCDAAVPVGGLVTRAAS